MPSEALNDRHWKALAVAYAAQPEGVKPDDAGAGTYATIGWKTWLRLRDYTYQGKEQPLIAEAHEWVQVRRRVFTGKRWPHDDEERVVTEREVRLRLTPFGRTFYQQHWHHYRHLYPKVEAPEPEQAESEANP